MALSGSVSAALNFIETSALDLAARTASINLVRAITFTSGTGANQVDVAFSDTRTLTASATEDLDLSGALTGNFGTSVFARLKVMLVYAAAANTNNVNVSRPSGATGVPIYLAVSDGEPVHPGGILLKVWPGATAIPVTSGTGDLITFTNSAAGTSVTYDVVLIGCSA